MEEIVEKNNVKEQIEKDGIQEQIKDVIEGINQENMQEPIKEENLEKENMKEEIRKKKLQKLKHRIIVPHNEFMKLFLVSYLDLDKNNRNPNVPIIAKVKIDRGLEVEFRVMRDEINKRTDILQEMNKKENANNMKQYLFRRCFEEYILFDRQSYLLYCILFDYYVNNQEMVDNDNYIIIPIKKIHQLYRGKTLKYFGAIDEKTLESYKKGLEDLRKKTIFINLQDCIEYSKEKSKKYIKIFCNEFGKMYINQNLIDYHFIKNSKGRIVSIKYKLGDLGKLILESGRMSTDIPIDLIRVPYKEISKFYLGMYISKIFFINKRNRRYKSISIRCLLQNIMSFYPNGSKKGMNKYQEIVHAKQKTKLITNFDTQLREVLDKFKDEKKISGYEITVDKITGRNFDQENTRLTIYF